MQGRSRRAAVCNLVAGGMVVAGLPAHRPAQLRMSTRGDQIRMVESAARLVGWHGARAGGGRGGAAVVRRHWQRAQPGRPLHPRRADLAVEGGGGGIERVLSDREPAWAARALVALGAKHGGVDLALTAHRCPLLGSHGPLLSGAKRGAALLEQRATAREDRHSLRHLVRRARLLRGRVLGAFLAAWLAVQTAVDVDSGVVQQPLGVARHDPRGARLAPVMPGGLREEARGTAMLPPVPAVRRPAPSARVARIVRDGPRPPWTRGGRRVRARHGTSSKLDSPPAKHHAPLDRPACNSVGAVGARVRLGGGGERRPSRRSEQRLDVLGGEPARPLVVARLEVQHVVRVGVAAPSAAHKGGHRSLKPLVAGAIRFRAVRGDRLRERPCTLLPP